LGGAVIGNAGAHDADMASSLLVAEILQQDNVIRSGKIKTDNLSLCETWDVKRLEYSYRSSILKENPGRAIVLSARLRLQSRPIEEIQNKMDVFLAQRKRTQPPGASMGSMFKNPPGDYAGRLIDACGLKGVRSGNAEISPIHANFFINHGNTSARDIWTLVQRAQRTVAEKYGIKLELEIERIGDWQNAA
jgi:UDP-N-acetylmuramate dehydrogenase